MTIVSRQIIIIIYTSYNIIQVAPNIFRAFDQTIEVAKYSEKPSKTVAEASSIISTRVLQTIDNIITKVQKDPSITLNVKGKNIAFAVAPITLLDKAEKVSVFSSERNNSLSITMKILQDIIAPDDLSVINVPKSVFSNPDQIQSIASVVYKTSTLFKPSVKVQQSSQFVGSVVHALVVGTQETENLTEPVTLIFKKTLPDRNGDNNNQNISYKMSSCSFWVSGKYHSQLIFLTRHFSCSILLPTTISKQN